MASMSRNTDRRSLIDNLCSSSRYKYLLVVFMVLAAAVLFASESLTDSKKDKSKDSSGGKPKFKNHKGEVVEAVYFENSKGKKAKQARVRNPWARVDRISVLGERNSGTRWITSELQKCFPNVEVKSELQRWKHWFQHDDGQEHLTTLVIAQFRDPYYWLEAMRHVPHHAPNHLYLAGDEVAEDDDDEDWKKFLSKEWTLGYRPKRDLAIEDKEEEAICYENFNYHELESCIEGSAEDPEYLAMFDKKTGLNKFGFPKDDPHDYKAAKPMYELQPNGKPYKSIMDLRSAKIDNFLSIKDWNWVKDMIPVRYEQLLADGTESLIRKIEEITTYKGETQLLRNCTPALPQTRSQRLLNPDMVNYINDNLNWKAEEKLGYKKLRKQTKDDVKEFRKELKIETKAKAEADAKKAAAAAEKKKKKEKDKE